jgi:hypothetical protein
MRGEVMRSLTRTLPDLPWKKRTLRAAMRVYWGRKWGCVQGGQDEGSRAWGVQCHGLAIVPYDLKLKKHK